MVRRFTLIVLLLLNPMLIDHALGWAQARFIHAAPIAADRTDTAISLYIAGDFSVGGFPHSYELHNILYQNYTNFFGYPAADFDVVIRSGRHGRKLVETTINLASGYSHWIILTGDGQHQDFEIQVVRGLQPAWDSGQHVLRFVHAAPVAADSQASALSIRDADGLVLASGLDDLGYGQASADVLMPVGPANFAIHAKNPGKVLLLPEPLELEAIVQTTAVLVIGNEVNQPLSLLAVPGGELVMIEPGEDDSESEVDNSVLGWWDTANTVAGEGLLLQPLPEQQRLVGAIYTYAEDDSGDQRWYVIESCRPSESGLGDCPDQAGFDGRVARATVFSARGGRLGGDEPVTPERVGWIEFEFFDCDQGLAFLSLDNGSMVSWDLQRLTRSVPCTLD